MNQSQYIIERKLNILELSETLGSTSKACRNLGVSRQHYYDIKGAIEEDGLEALLEKSRRTPRLNNRVAQEIEQALLDYSLEYPTYGQVRASNEIARKGIRVSPGGIRSISITATDFLNDEVLPFFDNYKIRLFRILTDNGREYCGTLEDHPFQLILHMNDIEHSRTRVRRPQSNGATEKLNQTIQSEFYKVAFRKNRYTSLEQIQTDLDAFV